MTDVQLRRVVRGAGARVAGALLLCVSTVTAGVLGFVPRDASHAVTLAPAAVADPVVAAAGDIACDPKNSNFKAGLGSTSSCHQKAVSDLLVNAGLAAVLDLGDNQYYCGGFDAFQQSYALSWGRVKDITKPAVGNHEYITDPAADRTGCDSTNAGAAGYYRYFGAAAGDPTKGYYSYDVGTWHAIVLNSSCTSAGGCGPTSPQGKWLRADLAAHQNFCTLAYWHIPLYSSGGRASSTYKTFWDALYAADADLVLAGHDHIYERFAPQDPSGAKDLARGLREFVVGTGGANHTSVTGIKPNSELRNSDMFGVLTLTLHPTGYDWRFVPEAGKIFTDSGTAACHGVRSDTVAPSAPTNVVAQATAPGQVSVSWGAATDDVAVLGYRVLRNGSQVGEVATTSFQDTTATPATIYSYSVVAYDAAGNVSAPSASATVTTAPDTTAPTAPTGLAATAQGPGRVDLTWAAGTDNVRVAGYDVLRDGVVVGTPTATSFSDVTTQPVTTYRYQVRARDDSGNVSPLSAAATVTTPDQPSVLTFAPVADTYVRADQASASFGSQPTLQVDGSPVKHTLLRFAVSGVSGRQVASATLTLHCTDSAGSGGVLYRTDGGAWSETTVTWASQPGTAGTPLGTLGKVVAGQAYQVDVGSLVDKDGVYDLMLTSTASDGADYGSREGGAALAPRLEVSAR